MWLLLARTRGVATVVGGVLLAIAIMGLIAFAVLMLDRVSQLENTMSQIAAEKVASRLQAESIVGWWWVGPPHTSPNNLIVHLESRASQAVAVTGVAIVWSDGTHTIVDRENGSLAALGITATITYRDGTSSSLDGFPIGLPPGAQLDIVFNGYAAARKPVTVSVSLSGPTLSVSAISLKNYTEVYGAGAGNATPPLAASLLANMLHAAGEWTVTWRGAVEGASIVEGLASVLSYTIVNGTYVSGTTASLETRDNDVLVVNGVLTRITQLGILSDNLIYATNFSRDVISSGEWTTVRGSWIWDPTVGISDGGLSGYSASVAPAIIYPTQISLASTTTYYIMAHVYPTICLSGIDFDVVGITLYDSLNDNAYMIGLDCDSIFNIIIGQYTLISKWTGAFSYIDYRLANSGFGLWNAYLVRYDSTNGLIAVEHYTPLSSDSLQVFDTSIRPNIAGLVVYYPSNQAYFDNFIVSKANPRWLNVTVVVNGSPVGSGWTVELYNGTGDLVATATTDSTGTASLDVLWQPIVWRATLKIYDPANTLQAVVRASDFGLVNLYGGNAYEVSIDDVYSVVLSVESQVPTSILSDLAGASVWYVFSVNASANYFVQAYDWVQDTWSILASGTYTPPVTVNANASIGSSYVNPVNGSVLIKLVVYSTQPLQVSVDVLNSVYKYYTYTVFDALLVGVGGTSLVDVYSYTSGGLVYMYSINVGSVFNGSTLIAYDPVGRRLVLANTSGIYVGLLSAQPGFGLVVSDCNTVPGPAALEVVNTTSNSYAIVVKSDGGYCVVDLSTNTTVASGVVGVSGCSLALAPPQTYIASARDPGSLAVFLVGYCTNTGQAVLVRGVLQGSTVSWSTLSALPGSRSVGLVAEDSSTLWLILSGGSLYKVYYNTTLGSWSYTLANVSIPFTPIDPGDRLEVLDATSLVFVRADYTNEIWRIPKS